MTKLSKNAEMQQSYETAVMQSVIIPQEIRIGNWINHNELGNIYVDGISPHCKDFKINNVFKWCYLKNCNSILLCEKWLTKFGFHYETQAGYSGYFKEYAFCTSIRIWKDKNVFKFSLNNFNSIDINSVHQLQNLFQSLTGRELTVA